MTEYSSTHIVWAWLCIVWSSWPCKYSIKTL